MAQRPQRRPHHLNRQRRAPLSRLAKVSNRHLVVSRLGLGPTHLRNLGRLQRSSSSWDLGEEEAPLWLQEGAVSLEGFEQAGLIHRDVGSKLDNTLLRSSVGCRCVVLVLLRPEHISIVRIYVCVIGADTLKLLSRHAQGSPKRRLLAWPIIRQKNSSAQHERGIGIFLKFKGARATACIGGRPE